MKVSLVIRVLNEAEALDALLNQLKNQKGIDELEVVVVDNQSSDSSADIAKKNGARVVTIKRSDFTYPAASNVGIKACSGELIAFTSAHSEVIHNDWLAQGAKWFDDPLVVGVHGGEKAMRDAPLAEKFYYSMSRLLGRMRRPKKIRKATMGVMGAANCMMRASYLKKHPYDESYAAGGEDQAWAQHALHDGKTLMYDPAFVLRHSHRLGARQLLRQHLYWYRLRKPHPFSRKKIAAYGRNFEESQD